MTGNQTLEARPMPAAVEIEQALISSLILHNNAIERVIEFLKPSHFYDPFFAELYQLCLIFYQQRRDINEITLKEYSGNYSEEERKERNRKIDELAGMGVAIVNTADYGLQIVDRFLRREMIRLGRDMAAQAYETNIETDAVDLLEKTQNRLYEISEGGQSDGGLKTFANSLASSIETINKAKKLNGKLPGVATNFTRLDRYTGGLHPSDLIILAGRPAMGKTALATCMAFNAAKDFYEDNKKAENKSNWKSVAFFSLEMSSAQLASRILSMQAQVNGTDLRNGTLDQAAFNRIVETSKWLQEFPLYIDDTPGLTMNQIRTRAKRLKRTSGLGLIVIDYLQLIENDSNGGKPENRVQELSKITRQLKLMAKEMNVPVLVLSQLNRGVENRDEKIPQLADLRESGSIEQDADIVMAVYREVYYLPKDPAKKAGESDEKFSARVADLERRREELKNIAEVLVLKNRHGETANVKLFFDGSHSNFTNLATDDPSNGK